MIDSGSTVSLLNSNTVESEIYEKILGGPIQINTIGGEVQRTTEYVKTSCPMEFKQNENAMIKWVKIALDKKYDFLLGMDFIEKNVDRIDIKNKQIILNNEIKLPFLNQILEEVNVLEKSEIRNIDVEHLNIEENNALLKMLQRYKKLLYTEGDRLTNTTSIVHEINTTTNEQINSKLYRYPPQHELEVRKQMKEMEEQGIIRKSFSKYSSPIIVIPKKKDNSGVQKYRIVVDYRRLNQVTIDDKYPLPNIDSILDKLGKAQYFSSLDLAKGYHQIFVAENDIEKTAFVTPSGLYEYVRMPFGLKNAPATFQRLMNEILREYINKICVVYLDDILVFSTTLEEHLISLEKIFRKLTEHNLKIQADKCSFMKKETSFLGHILTNEGIKPNNTNVENIKRVDIPKTEKQLKSFLGMTGFYRKFIKDYAKVAHPLIKYLKKDSKINIKDPQYIESFEQLKLLICSHPILKYPIYDKEFTITTDASDYAIGAVLSQEGHPICYVSRTLNNHERKYSVTDKEFLAIVYSVNYFRPYVYGRKFKIITDHVPIKYLNEKYKGKEFSQRNQRWILKLQEYSFDIEYLQGKDNKVADFLSRIENSPPINDENSSESNMDLSDTIHSVEEQLLDHIGIKDEIVNKYKTQMIITYNPKIEFEVVHNRKIIYINPKDETENIINILKRNIKSGWIGIYCEVNDKDFNEVQKIIIKLFSNDNKIRFIRSTKRAEEIKTEAECHRQISIYHIKESLHSGINETYHTLKNKIYYPKLQNNIQLIINNCGKCKEIKYDRKPIKAKFELTETPNEKHSIIHLDVFHYKKQTFVTIIDKLTKFAIAYLINDRNWVKKIAVLEGYIASFDKPTKIIMDNEFKSEKVKEYLEQKQIEVHWTKPNNHTGNADVERLHSTIIEKIQAVEEDISLEHRIQKAIGNYNDRYHTTIKMTPREASKLEDITLLIDRVNKKKLENVTKENKNRESYVEKRKDGYIKNYKRLRHKDQPYFRKYALNNVHVSNIKRPSKFTGNNVADINDDQLSTRVNTSTTNTRGDRVH